MKINKNKWLSEFIVYDAFTNKTGLLTLIEGRFGILEFGKNVLKPVLNFKYESENKYVSVVSNLPPETELYYIGEL